MIIVGDIGLVPVSPDAAEGFYCLLAAATAYPAICIWSVSGCAEIGRVQLIAIGLPMALSRPSCLLIRRVPPCRRVPVRST